MPPAGRNCSLRYRYSPSVFCEIPEYQAETLYVIGGLYGNHEALKSILKMKADEEQQGRPVLLVFNGDFNWFNVDHETFEQINYEVLRHSAIQGNVEMEMADPSEDTGCGCNYPEWVAEGIVERSNQIIQQLQSRAEDYPEISIGLRNLPRYLRVKVGDHVIGIVHGDAQSLAGWAFAAECLPGETSSGCGTSSPSVPTSYEQITRYFI
ncbi:MAG: metallophosphoesterase, partial [SAR324 cluster bacterium]|nr:metallophosphoesterase [SAR324 cluster bacterium]